MKKANTIKDKKSTLFKQSLLSTAVIGLVFGSWVGLRYSNSTGAYGILELAIYSLSAYLLRVKVEISLSLRSLPALNWARAERDLAIETAAQIYAKAVEPDLPDFEQVLSAGKDHTSNEQAAQAINRWMGRTSQARRDQSQRLSRAHKVYRDSVQQVRKTVLPAAQTSAQVCILTGVIAAYIAFHLP